MVFKRIFLALERIEKRQEQILAKLSGPQADAVPSGTNAWLEKGIDNILSYQVGKKGGEEE